MQLNSDINSKFYKVIHLEKIFKSFVTDIYNIQLQYSKDHLMNYIAKILLNSLCKRIGMDNRFIYTSVVSKDSFLKYKEKNYSKIKDIINLGENYLVEVEGNETRIMLDN